MRNAKRFISVILALIMICSTLVVGANAAYTAYKDSAIADSYDDLDKPVLTTAQYASAAMDELDRMLNKEQIKMTSDELFGIGELDVTSVDATMDSVYNLVNSAAFTTVKGLLGDLSKLSADALAPTEKNGEGGIRRSTEGKTDVDVIYCLIRFLYDNKDIFVSYVDGTINLGTILPSVVDLSDYTDVNKLLKSLLYEATYSTDEVEAEAPDDLSKYTITGMAQDLIDKVVLKFVPELEGKTTITSGKMYDFIDTALKTLYNTLLRKLLNGNVKYELNKFCGVTEITTDADYNILSSNTATANKYADLINVNYTIPEYTFTSATLASQFNDVVGSLLNAMCTDSFKAKFTWESGNENLLDNLIGVAKVVVTDDELAESFFQPYNTRYTDEEINAMTAEELITYLLRTMINNSVDELWIPESATTLREFGFYCLQQLLATAAPELDFSSLDKNSTDSLIVMGIDFAIYNINANLDMGLSYVYDMDGVSQQLANAATYGVKNYGGLLNGITFRNSADGWGTFDDIIFSIIDKTWLPTSCSSATYCFKTLLIDTLINNILDLKVADMLALLENNHAGGLNDTPEKVVLDLARKIINVIFPNAISEKATTFDEIATNAALADTVDAIFTDLYTYRSKLVSCILPTLCSILDLTNEQEFEFPEYTYEEFNYTSSGSIDDHYAMRNGSTGINTGYTDAKGEFHQDSLYTYEIKSLTITPATAGAATLTVKYSTLNADGETYTDWSSTTTNPKLAGGQTGYLHISGSVTAKTAVRIDVTYDVLTEDGTALTSAPITDYIYTYYSGTATDSETMRNTKTATSANSYDVEFPAFNYCSSVRDITNIEATITNNTTNVMYASAYNSTTNATITKLLNTGWIEYNTDTVINPGFVDDEENFHSTKTTVKLFKTTAAYDALPDKVEVDADGNPVDPNAKSKETAWQELKDAGSTFNKTGVATIIGKFAGMPVRIGLASTAEAESYTDITGGTTNTLGIYLYDSCNLASILEDEMGKHRQEANYSDASAWTAYMLAMNTAAGAVYSPYANTSFSLNSKNGKLYQISTAAEALETAIENLDKVEIGGGFTEILAYIDSVNPSNVDADENPLSYDDANYKFFGVADYEGYTYYNYRDVYRAAMSAYESTVIPNDEGELATVSALEVAQLYHDLKTYGSRLLKKSVSKQHLVAQLAAAQQITAENEALYTAESWADYVKAYNFATTVNSTADASLTQTKVNKAYEVLLEYEKCLVKATGGDTPSGDDPVVNPVDPSSKAALTVIETAGSGNLLGGVQPGADPTTLFTGSGFTVEATKAGSTLATGDTITVKNATTGEVISTYQVCISGDVNCDGAAGDAQDLVVVLNISLNIVTPTDVVKNAGDISGSDGKTDAMDLIEFVNVALSIKSIDYNNRTVK